MSVSRYDPFGVGVSSETVGAGPCARPVALASRTTALLFLAGTLAWPQVPYRGPGLRPNAKVEQAFREVTELTTGLREDDHASLSSNGREAWIAWVSYSESDDSSLIFARSLKAGETEWSPPEPVTDTGGDYYKPTVAVDEASRVWVIWPAQVGGNWDLYGRVRDTSGSWSAVERLTDHPGPDQIPRAAASDGRVMVVWQGIRNGSLDILYRIHEDGTWGQERFVTDHPANDWEPVVAGDSRGDFHVAWDSYRGDYDVLLRTWSANGWGPERAVAASPRLENRPDLAVDGRDRVWISWETGPQAWASDSATKGLRAEGRKIGIACLQNGKLYHPLEATRELQRLAGWETMEAPAMAVGEDGKLRLFFRHHVRPPWLSIATTIWEDGQWAPIETVFNTEGRIDQRLAVGRLGNETLLVYPMGSLHNFLYAKHCKSGPPISSAQHTPPLTPVETLVAKPAPATQQRHSFSGYELYWGDTHRHTDISLGGGQQQYLDGSLTDNYRYAIDAADLDFLGTTENTRYLTRRYNVWRSKQAADLYTYPTIFAGLHTYERSQQSPWGHRTILNLARAYAPVPASYIAGDLGVSPWGLWAALRGTKAITIPHHIAFIDKQVSWDYHDPKFERLVEIFQGFRGSYEYLDSPDGVARPEYLKYAEHRGFRRKPYERDSKSFVWDALARKRKLGFIASSDHLSTHNAFAAVYAKGPDRESLFEAMYDRRTYAATDRIVVEFSIEGHLMGEEITIAGKPELKVAIRGTSPLKQVDIIKEGKFVFTTSPGRPTTEFTFRDEEFDGEECYYYVRVIQTNKQMAWASPIWVRRAE